MPFLEVLLFIIYFLAVILSMALSTIIWKHLNKKSLGMQTLIDPLIKDLIVLAFATLSMSSITTLGIGAPYHVTLAWVIIGAYIFVAHAMLLQNLSMVIIRYLHVFHSNLFESLDISDATFVSIIRIGNMLLSLAFATFEYMDQNIEEVQSFKNLSGKDEDDSVKLNAKILKALGIANLIAIIAIHIRIEKFKGQDEQMKKLQYSLKTLRIMAAISTLFVLILVLRTFGAFGLLGINGKLVRAIITVGIAFDFLPALIIYKNEKMFGFAKKLG